ncbi:MAG: DUF5647 family protein [Thermomicrobiales bacterium]
MNTKTADIRHTSIEADALVTKQLDLVQRFHTAAFAEPALLDEIPDGATLVLLPDDDDAFVEESIAIGIQTLRHGRDVYFRHVRMAELPG